jgi:hypothetical protein
LSFTPRFLWSRSSMAVFLVRGKSADGDHQKPEKAPSVAGGAFSG